MTTLGRLKQGSGLTWWYTRGLLWAAGAGVAVILAGCASPGMPTAQLSEPLPSPTDPAFESRVLELRTERVNAVERWKSSLEAMDQLIRARESGVPTASDQDLIGWRGEMEVELLQAEAALSRLEQGVRQDFNGQLPAWWPPEQT